jgi:zinc protease
MKSVSRPAPLRSFASVAAVVSLAAVFMVPALDAKTPAKAPAHHAKAHHATAHHAAAKPPAPSTPDAPWLYRGSDVPQDKAWVFGTLPNGLRYAVRKNGVPPGQVSIRVRIDAGSLNERDHERGFAHLIEHLVFRQSKYLGEAQAIPTWQRLGATFGSDTNAETTPTSTTYKIDLPQATPAALDESFKLLSGMMIAPSLSTANIRAELPIVLAEKREHGGAGERVDAKMRATLFGGQPLAQREPIGTEATLNAASQASVRAFHARWYRPGNAVVIVAGDASTDDLAALVRRWFSDWPVSGPQSAPPSFGIPLAGPDAIKTGGGALAPIGSGGVQVEADLPRSVTWAVLRPWQQITDSIAYNQGLMIDHVAQEIINRRLETRARSGGSFLVARINQQKISRSSDATYISVAPTGPNWQAVVKDVRAVIADALASPPSQAEIDRELAEMRIAYANGVEQRDLLPGAQVADDLVQALDIRETVAAPEAVLAIFDSSVKLFTPAAVQDHTRQLFSGAVTRGFMITPVMGEANAAALRSALAVPVAADGSARVEVKVLRFADLPTLGTPQRPAAVSQTGLSAIEQVDFANGVKAQIWATDDEPGRVTVKVRFGAGYRAFGPDDAPYIALGATSLISQGLGSLGEDGLERIATGRKMGFDFSIGEASFSFSADTRREDVADQLYLFAAKLAQPRWDEAPLQRAKVSARLQYDSMAASPQGVLARDLDWLEHNRDPRYRVPTPAEIEAATPDRFRALWEPILLSGPIEVQVFGDIDHDQTIAALGKTFGALATRPPLSDAMLASQESVPVGGGPPLVLTHRGDAAQAAALVFWPTGGGIAGVTESRQLRILAELFSNRLMDRMRDKLGAAYSPQVYTTWPVDLPVGGAVIAMAQVQPRDVPAFYAAADAIAAALVANPPSADELARVTEPLKQQITRAFTASSYFMYQIEGATRDARRYAALHTLLPDSTVTTPQAMQALAAKYLVAGQSWRLVVLPQGQELVVAPAPSGGVGQP